MLLKHIHDIQKDIPHHPVHTTIAVCGVFLQPRIETGGWYVEDLKNHKVNAEQNERVLIHQIT